MPPLLQLQKLPEKADGEWGKKGCLRHFSADLKIASSVVEKKRLGAS